MTAPSGQPLDDIELLRSVEQADVIKTGRRAATLIRTAAGIEFRYLDEWIDAGGPAVASTLPLDASPVVHAAGALPAFFTGLLPEGRRLGALRRATKTSADDELTLLLAVGTDAIGDVQVVPSGHAPAPSRASVAIEDVSAISFAELLDELGVRAQRVALPGVQDKTSAAMINLPASRAGDRQILKLNPKEFPHLAENEAFFLGAAQKAGLTVPDYELVADREGRNGLLVRRFDRVTVNGAVHSLAVEDGCQVLDRPPADKYRMRTDRVFAALSAVCGAPVVAGRELIKQLVFAYLTGNGDAHAKNFSVRQGLDGEWHVSPAYDVPCSYLYGDTTMAMSMTGRVGSDLGAADFVDLGARLGVPDRAVRRVLNEQADRADLWLPALPSLPFDNGRINKLRRVIAYRRSRLRTT